MRIKQPCHVYPGERLWLKATPGSAKQTAKDLQRIEASTVEWTDVLFWSGNAKHPAAFEFIRYQAT
jgi:hypothetical protein